MFFLFSVCTVTRAQSAASVITGFDRPFLFAYGSWQNVAKIEAGHLVLNTPTAQGGLGDNLAAPLNLNARSEYSPTLRLRIGPNNKEQTLRLLLADAKGGNSTWDFSLVGVKVGEDVVLTPVEGAPLSTPSSSGDKGPADLSQIFQWQVMGDWSAGSVDLSLDLVELIAPDEILRTVRLDAQKRRQAEADKARQQQLALKEQFKPGQPLSPQIVGLAPVAPNVLSLQIHAGKVLRGAVVSYAKQDGDTTREKKRDDGTIESLILVRGGKDVGWLIGPKRDSLTTRERFEGDPLIEWVADQTTTYAVSSSDDPAFKTPVVPKAVHRKSTPTLWAEDSSDFEMRHTLYLELPSPLLAGKHYTVSVGELNTRTPSATFEFDAAKVCSEAVHVNQIGFRADDPVKGAFVSCWMGNGGVLHLPAQMKFSLVEDATGKVVFSSQSSDLWPADKLEHQMRDANFSGTDVMRLDFSSFNTPGRFRVVVQGIGCSYPFPIGPDVWQTAFKTQMKGLYNQRSGEELGLPYTPFKKPRDMKPGDEGVSVTWTKYRFTDGGDLFAGLFAGDTGKPAPGGGGYHDAGDWNPRRVTHMRVTMASLELFEMFPAYFEKQKLGIPPRAGVPDVLTEAIFEFETFHRLQQEDGGVGYGLETNGDPNAGEVSWLQSFKIYALSPDYQSSWYYAAVGARLANALKPYDRKLAATYQQSAVDAWKWADKTFAADKAAGLTDKRATTHDALSYRNLSALALYRLTGDKQWHDRFMEDTVLSNDAPDLGFGDGSQQEQAFLYARLPANLGDAKLKTRAVAAFEYLAKRALTYAGDNAWNLTTPDKGKPQFLGFYSGPDASVLTRAHFLTGKTEYLAGAVAATGFSGGANPNNLVYTSGLGANPVQNPFHLDARRSGQQMPVGLTPYGNVDFARWGDQQWIMWPITYFLSKNTTPHPLAWPVNEAYWDTGGWPALNEFTVDAWTPNVAVWGYLAARK